MAHAERSNARPHADTTDHGVSLAVCSNSNCRRIIIQSWLFGAAVVSVMNWWTSESAKHERRWVRMVLVSTRLIILPPLQEACMSRHSEVAISTPRRSEWHFVASADSNPIHDA